MTGDAIETHQVQTHLLRASDLGGWLLGSSQHSSERGLLTSIERISRRLRRRIIKAATHSLEISQGSGCVHGLGDDLLIVSNVQTVRAASVVIHQRVMRGADDLADGRITAAFLGPDDRPRRQPREWVERFKTLSED